MENRIATLEAKCEMLEREVERLEKFHNNEVSKMKKSIDNLSAAIGGMESLVKQIKYYILGIATVIVAGEIGVTQFISILLKGT